METLREHGNVRRGRLEEREGTVDEFQERLNEIEQHANDNDGNIDSKLKQFSTGILGTVG